MPKKQNTKTSEHVACQEEIGQLKDMVLRSQADYQNLVRRQQQERAKLITMATSELVESLIEPLEHLAMTAQQLTDPALDMVSGRIMATLQEFGLEEINPEGQKFDVNTMEAIEGSQPDGDLVSKVQAKGYKLNGQVIRHAKVLGGKESK